MIPLAAALSLAQYAPTILRFFGAGEKSASVAEKVAGIAQTVAGTNSVEDALDVFQKDSGKRYEFQKAVMENDAQLEIAYLADRQSARNRDQAFVVAGTRNYRADFMFLLAVIVIVGIAAAIWNTPGIDEYTKGIATLILGRFLGYLDNIYNFEFGSTRSSKQKDASIENLTAKEKE